MMRLDLGDGQWAELKDSPANGARRKAWEAFSTVTVPALADMEALDILLADMVTAWSFDLPIPATKPDVMDELTLDQANALYGALWSIFPKLKPSFVVDAADGSPTSPSKS